MHDILKSVSRRKELVCNQCIQGVATCTVQVQLMKDMSSTIDAEVEMAWKLEAVELAQKCL